MATEIFKLQRSIATNDPRGQLCLIYNKDRSILKEGPYNTEMDVMFGTANKVYVEGEFVNIDGKQKFGVVKVVENQDW